MRLINVRNFEIKEFFGANIPEYAILSHTWGEEEVSFQDMQGGIAKLLKGFKKIELCCKQAREDDFDWAWIDTCCIDKTSSAELSEAINSTYQWYAAAVVCYAYLDAVLPQEPQHALGKFRWFQRGWTLQELIAPHKVIFYDQDWKSLGTKQDNSEQLEQMTNIDARVLNHSMPLHSVCVAKKFSWALQRSTTRIEDMAYCLMGLFNVNLPLLYGEGKKAFFRLQEEILKSTADHSMFAWWSVQPRGLPVHTDVLSDSVRHFGFSRNIHKLPSADLDDPPTMTSRGIRMRLPFKQLRRGELGSWVYSRLPVDVDEYYLVALRCQHMDSAWPIFLVLVQQQSGEFDRVQAHALPGIDLNHLNPQDIVCPSCAPADIAEWPLKTFYIRARCAGFALGSASPPKIDVNFGSRNTFGYRRESIGHFQSVRIYHQSHTYHDSRNLSLSYDTQHGVDFRLMESMIKAPFVLVYGFWKGKAVCKLIPANSLAHKLDYDLIREQRRLLDSGNYPLVEPLDWYGPLLEAELSLSGVKITAVMSRLLDLVNQDIYTVSLRAVSVDG